MSAQVSHKLTDPIHSRVKSVIIIITEKWILRTYPGPIRGIVLMLRVEIDLNNLLNEMHLYVGIFPTQTNIVKGETWLNTTLTVSIFVANIVNPDWLPNECKYNNNNNATRRLGHWIYSEIITLYAKTRLLHSLAWDDSRSFWLLNTIDVLQTYRGFLISVWISFNQLLIHFLSSTYNWHGLRANDLLVCALSLNFYISIRSWFDSGKVYCPNPVLFHQLLNLPLLKEVISS